MPNTYKKSVEIVIFVHKVQPYAGVERLLKMSEFFHFLFDKKKRDSVIYFCLIFPLNLFNSGKGVGDSHGRIQGKPWGNVILIKIFEKNLFIF